MKNPNDYEGCFGVIAEFSGQAPILMESEYATHQQAHEWARSLKGARRYCIVRLEYDGGDELLLHDLLRMSEIKEAADKAKEQGLF